MAFDAVTLAAVRDEVETLLLGGRVERVVLPAELAIGIEFYAHGVKRWLFASAHPQQARVHLVADRLARTSEDVSPLLLLMRKYVRDGRLVAVNQAPWERVLSLSFGKRDDDGAALECTLIIEIMGRHSNIVLVSDNGRVLDSAKRVSTAISRQRTVLPGQQYVPPPPLTKVQPDALSEERLRELCHAQVSGQGLLAQALVASLAGFSPLLAREVAFRATGSVITPIEHVDWQAVALQIQELAGDLANRRWNPSIGLVEGEIADFAPYELRQFGSWQSMESISAAAEAFYARRSAPTRAGETGKAALRNVLADLRARAERRQRALRESLSRFEEVDRLRRRGELLFAYGHTARRGDTSLSVEGEQIPLDPLRSVTENAQAYFKEYQKAKAGLEEVPQLLRTVEAELAFLAQAETDLELAATPSELEEVRHELRAAGLLRDGSEDKKKRRDRPLPIGRPVVSSDGLEIMIGRSARQNERITFDMATGSDLWLHARGIPGAHVIVKARGQEVPESTLQQAAEIAAYFSQARASSSVAVDYTQQRNVRRIKGGPPGLVNYVNERTVHVRPAPPPTSTRGRLDK